MRVKRGSHCTLVHNKCSHQFSPSVMSDSLRPCGLQHDRLPVHHQILSLLKFMSIKLVMPSNHLILYHSLLLLLSIFPRVRVFLKEPILHMRWPKYWNFSFNISPSNEYSGLISFTMDSLGSSCFQGTLKSLLQHHSSKESILPCSAFLWSISHIHTWLLEKP